MEEIFPIEDWWTLTQLELVNDRSRRWVEQEFYPSDMTLFRRDGRAMGRPKAEGDEARGEGEIIAGGWDHEHCALCWRTISRYAEDQQTGYTDGEKWLCCKCFETYIAPREKPLIVHESD